MSATRLYTPQMLAAAVELAEYPRLENAPLHGEARAPVCGSNLTMDLALDDDGAIARIGLQVSACAVGQASAALFARHAVGCKRADISRAHQQLLAWLADADHARPDWPGLELIEPARDYPARHGASVLAWKAADETLSRVPAAS